MKPEDMKRAQWSLRLHTEQIALAPLHRLFNFLPADSRV